MISLSVKYNSDKVDLEAYGHDKIIRQSFIVGFGPDELRDNVVIEVEQSEFEDETDLL